MMAAFNMNVSIYKRETNEQYLPDPTPEGLNAAQEQDPPVVDVKLASGRHEYDV